MSYSSLIYIDKDFNKQGAKDFHNAWLYHPVVWDVLSEKYLGFDEFGKIRHVVNVNGRDVWTQINDKINVSPIMEDRIAWELSNECVFRSSDKNYIADALLKFLEINAEYDGKSLKQLHIKDRFKEVAAALRAVDEDYTAYIVFKGTSVDDSVLNWFEIYNEETDGFDRVSIKDRTEVVCEFVEMENGQITDFKTNLQFCQQ